MSNYNTRQTGEDEGNVNLSQGKVRHLSLGQTFPLFPGPGLCDRGTEVTKGLPSCTRPGA